MSEQTINLTLDTPYETLEYLTSENNNYNEMLNLAVKLSEQIPVEHTNKDDKKFHAITQVILECFKRIKGFHSTKWVSLSKLENELIQGEKPINFKRINANKDICEYNIINFDQIDFTKILEYADEFDIISKRPEPSLKNLNKQKNDESLEYNKVLTLLLNGENVFLTGYAGTGKSYILNKLKEKFKKKLTITSTTGIAAVNVKGQTLHSWAGVGLCKNPVQKTVEKIRTRVTTLKQILNCKILAVDEISMLNIETFEYVDEVLRLVRNSSEPFGGIQVIFIGDFFQLPPVEKNAQNELLEGLEDIPKKRFCFESQLWQDFKFKNIILKQNYRQSERDFIKALSDMRENSLTNDDIKLLTTRETNLDTFETDILHIFSTNEEADKYNLAKFKMINEPVKLFEATDGVYRGNRPVYGGFTENENYVLEIFGRNCRADKTIALKLGARVMLLINMDFNKGLINGSCGKIIAFEEDTITVKFDNGVAAEIPQHKFEYYYHDKVAAERTQFPLKLAYGITIHKSQGMTLDKLVVDCSRIFERGQAYVAMSRVKTLDGLYLKAFSPDKVMVDEKVAEFYENLQETVDVKLNEHLAFNLEEEEEEEKVKIDDAKKIIIECVKEFSGQYGKSGIMKILSGSRSFANNEFHSKAVESKFFGSLNGWKQKEITALIDNLVKESEFEIKHVSYGRPILCIKNNS